MAAIVTRKRARNRRPDVLQKPRRVVHPRVQKVGPERFGIVAVDCAKARSKWMLSDFYGNVLLPPAIVEHNRAGFDAAVAALGQAAKEDDLGDLLVAVERTGRYHHAPARAVAAGGFEVRTVHPFTTSPACLRQVLAEAAVGFQQRTLDRVNQWADAAAAPDAAASHHRRIAADLEADRRRKELEIQALEREIASLLARTPYVLLMSIPGVNVVSASEYAAEMGPICNYANARCVTGRAGLYPSRHQSDQVGLAGRMVGCANRRLRHALMHRQHQTPPLQVQRDLQQASMQLPPGQCPAEAKPLQEELKRIVEKRRRGPQPLGEILPAVLAELAARTLQSPPPGNFGVDSFRVQEVNVESQFPTSSITNDNTAAGVPAAKAIPGSYGSAWPSGSCRLPCSGTR